MEFFDKKEEVIEIKLTPWGRYRLSQSRFRPAYYSFFDNGILYDSGWTTGPAGRGIENQNEIESRIQENTPSLKTLNVFVGRETTVKERAGALRAALDLHEPQTSESPAYVERSPYFLEELQPTAEKYDFVSRPIGTSKLTSKYSPAWALNLYQGEISSSIPYVETLGGYEKIPQLNIKITYNQYTGQFESYTQTGAGTTDNSEETDLYFTNPHDANNLQSVVTNVLADGTYIIVDKTDLVLRVSEENADFLKENYSMEVFLSSSDTAIETKQLFFNNTIEDPTINDVEYYLTLDVDKEIENSLLRKLGITDLTALGVVSGKNVVSTRNYFIKNLYEPEEDICE
jgi:hypothetical protein